MYNKTGNARQSMAHTFCSLCDLMEPETEGHLLLHCTRYETWRRPLRDPTQPGPRTSRHCSKQLPTTKRNSTFSGRKWVTMTQTCGVAYRETLVKAYLKPSTNTGSKTSNCQTCETYSISPRNSRLKKRCDTIKAELRMELGLDEIGQDALQVPHSLL